MSNETEELLTAREEKRLVNSEREYLEALELFSEFDENTDKEILSNTAQKLINAIGYKRNNPEPYICLSYIFYLLDNDKLALDYLGTARSYDRENPRINELYTIITGSDIMEDFPEQPQESLENIKAVSESGKDPNELSFSRRLKLLGSTNLSLLRKKK